MARGPAQCWMAHLPLVLLGIRSSIREDGDVSPAHLVYGTPLRLPGQLLVDPPVSKNPLSSFASDLESSLSRAAPLPVVFPGDHPVSVPKALDGATSVYVRVDSVQPPLSRPYEGPFPVISRSEKKWENLGG